AYRQAGDAVRAPGHLEGPLDDLAVGVDGDLPPIPDRRTHVDGGARDTPAGELGLDYLDARVGFDPERVRPHESAVVDELREPPDAVAAHLRAAAVCIVDDHAAVAPVRRRQQKDEAIGADAAAAIAETWRQRRGVAGKTLACI